MKTFLSAVVLAFIAVPAHAQEEPVVPQVTTNEAEAVATPVPPTIIIKEVSAKVNLGGIRRDIAELKRFRAQLKSKPESDLSPEQRTLLSELLKIDRIVPKLEQLKDGTPTTYLTKDEQLALASVKTLKQTVEALSGWQVRDYAFGLVLAALCAGFAGLLYRLKAFKVWLLREFAILKGRVTDLEDRYQVRVGKIETGPLRTLLPAEIRALSVGTAFSYFVLVDGQLARYEMTVTNRTEKGKDVTVICQQITAGVTSRMLHKTLCHLIENNGGMHPFVAMAA
jgi:hypothetical protein